MNVALVIIRKPPVDVVTVDLLNVFVNAVASAVDNRSHVLLHPIRQAHLPVEPVRCALLERAAAAVLSVVEIDFFPAVKFLIGIEIEPVGIAVARVPAGAAANERAAAVTQADVIKYLRVVVNERAIQQLVREIRTRAERIDYIVRKPDTIGSKPAAKERITHADQAGSLRHIR